MTSFVCFFVISLIQVSVAHYDIVQEENLYDYNMVSETTTRTYTECILKCDHDLNCSSLSIQENEDGRYSCILLEEKVKYLNLSNPGEFKKVNQALTVKKIGDHITLLGQLDKPQIPCTAWSELSNCDVTCGNGTMFRERTCLKKCLQIGREEYVKENETKNCIKNPCLVQVDVTARQHGKLSIGCNPHNEIAILRGIYGNKGKDNCSRDVTEQIKSLCKNRQSCAVDAADHVFGDPCMYHEKTLSVTYVCRPVPPPGLSV